MRSLRPSLTPRSDAVLPPSPQAREAEETQRLLLAAAPRVYLVGGTPDSLHAEYLGAYDREPELVNGRLAYAMAGDADKMLWFSSVNGYWHAGPRANLGGPRGWLAVYDRAPLPDRVTAEWQVGAADSSWTAAPDVRCLAADPRRPTTRQQARDREGGADAMLNGAAAMHEGGEGGGRDGDGDGGEEPRQRRLRSRRGGSGAGRS